MGGLHVRTFFFFRPPRVSAVPEHRETCLRVHASCRSTERRASACAHLTNGRNVSVIWCQGPRAHTTPGPARKRDTHFTKNVFRKRCISGRRERIPRRTLSHGLTSVGDTHQQLWGPTDSCQAFFFFFSFLDLTLAKGAAATLRLGFAFRDPLASLGLYLGCFFS